MFVHVTKAYRSSPLARPRRRTSRPFKFRLLSPSLIVLCCALIAGCAQAGGPNGALQYTPATASTRLARVDTTSYKILYSFGKKRDDGEIPNGPVLAINGTLYGTTAYGGPYGTCSSVGCGDGIVYSLSTGGVETTLHFFGKGKDGREPVGNLVDMGGTLYGTTSYGGRYGGGTEIGGTVFGITPTGTYSVLYNFGKDCGVWPLAGLAVLKGTLYGTTVYGCGSGGYGTVFSVTSNGQENVLHTFIDENDGVSPESNLIAVSGALYGTTDLGGKPNCGAYGYDCGTVFRITTAGALTVLHRFTGGRGGSNPGYGSLVEVKGTLYGTTESGGQKKCDFGGTLEGCGTVFSINTSGTDFKILHSFDLTHDGGTPYAGLVYLNGALYGTAGYGGAEGTGTVFKITPAGEFSVVHTFGTLRDDGERPSANLILVNGTLYGTTIYGGAHGDGIVFELKP